MDYLAQGCETTEHQGQRDNVRGRQRDKKETFEKARLEDNRTQILSVVTNIIVNVQSKTFNVQESCLSFNIKNGIKITFK